MKEINRKIMLFLFKFFVLSLIFYSFLFYSTFSFSFLERLEAETVNLFFNEKIVELSSFYHKTPTYAIYFFKENVNYYFIIDRDCLGINIFGALAVFVLSFPGKNKLIFLFLSFFLIEFLNILRLILLFYLFKYHYNFYEFYHNFIWQITNFLVLIFLVFLYLKVSNKTKIL